MKYLRANYLLLDSKRKNLEYQNQTLIYSLSTAEKEVEELSFQKGLLVDRNAESTRQLQRTVNRMKVVVTQRDVLGGGLIITTALLALKLL